MIAIDKFMSWTGILTWLVTVGWWGTPWCFGAGPLLTLVVHTPALTNRAVALQWAVLSLLITLWDEGSDLREPILRTLRVSVVLTMGLGTLRAN